MGYFCTFADALYNDPGRAGAQFNFKDTLRHFKPVVGGAAASIIRLLPSLQYVFLTTSACFGNFDIRRQWRVARAWRVIPASDAVGEAQDGQPVLVNLTGEAAKTIIRKEELVLSEADGVSLSVCNIGEVSLNSPLRNAGRATHTQGLAYRI